VRNIISMNRACYKESHRQCVLCKAYTVHKYNDFMLLKMAC